MYENIEISTLLIQITNQCNLNCSHCYLSGGKSGEMSVDSLQKIINEAIQYDTKEIILTGGEPLIHSDIHKVLNLINLYPQVNFGLVTNGTLLNEAIIKEVEGKENTYIQVSFDGSSQEIYEQIRGKGTFEGFWRGFNLLAASHVKDKRSRTAVSTVNYKDVEKICKIAYENEITPSFLATVKMGNANENWNALGLTEIQKMKVNNTIKNFNKQHKTGINILTPPTRCCFSSNEERKSFNVSTEGYVSVCDFLYDIPIGNLFEEHLDHILRGEPLQKLYDIGTTRRKKLEEENCKDCELKSDCYFGCPAEARNAGNVYGCDMHCNYRKLFYSCTIANLV